MKNTKIILLCFLFTAFAVFTQAVIKTKAGIIISSSDKFQKLKSNSVVKSSDKFRILLQPESVGYAYFVMIEGGYATLLNFGKVYKNQRMVYPAKTNFAPFANKGKYRFYLIFSPNKLNKIDQLFAKSGRIVDSKFLKIINEISKGKPNITDDNPDDIMIAGNTRGKQEEIDTDFLKKFKAFTNKGEMLLEYNIIVK